MVRFLPILLCLALARAQAQTGESVVVIYNRSMPSSKAVAEHYAARRAVPQNQLIAFELPQSETITRADFESQLQQPLWNALRERGLLVYGPKTESTNATRSNVTAASIRFAVLCYGVPLKIMPDPGRRENPGSLPQELQRNEAAVESELALLPLLDQKLQLIGPLGNPVAGSTNLAAFHPTNGVLIVTRLDGPTPEIAMGLVDKAIQAEQEGLWGKGYFDTRGITNGAMRLGDDMIRGASDSARAYGFEIVHDTAGRTFPPSTPLPDIAFYFGWYDQSVSGPFTNGMAQFRPGAVAYHLHSFSSRALRVTDTWWTGPLLAAGATATMGCTEEPYLQLTPQVNAFMWRFVQLGFSFGEAAYASLPVLSWQNAIIGDPLYRPFSRTQKERYEELEKSGDEKIEWSMLAWLNIRLAQEAPLNEIEQFYRDNPATAKSALLQEKLGDVYKGRGKLIDALDPYETALDLATNSLHRLQLILKAGPLFSSMGRGERAYQIYTELLRDFPEYSDKKTIYERLAALASRLQKSSEAAEYRRLAREAGPNS